MTKNDWFRRESLIENAVCASGSDDFGENGWQEGLDLLIESLVTEARLNELGCSIAAGELQTYLTLRAGITAHRNQHPGLASAPIEKPIVIMGQPRTGTTIFYDLISQDPVMRSPLTWEVDNPLPPPQLDTYETDPRIAATDATLAMVDSVIPGFTDHHPMSARHAQECVRITASDFRSMIFATQYRVPTYNRWLLHEADFAPAYRWHRRYLQHLQSGVPATRWLLKSPAHMWHLGALLAEYPDAILIQAHRDPLKVISSVSALVAVLRSLASDETSIPQAAAEYAEDIFLGLERSIAARDDGTVPPNQIIDVQFTEFLDDPIATIRRVYDEIGLELTADTERRMRDFLSANPGDGGGAGKRYRFSDTELDEGEIRERSRAYMQRFDVTEEPAA
jgi:hypothetical protein